MENKPVSHQSIGSQAASTARRNITATSLCFAKRFPAVFVPVPLLGIKTELSLSLYNIFLFQNHFYKKKGKSPQASCKHHCTTISAISLHSEKKCVFLYPVFSEGPEGKSTFSQMWNIFPQKDVSLPAGVIVVLEPQSARLALFELLLLLLLIPLALNLELSKLQEWKELH